MKITQAQVSAALDDELTQLSRQWLIIWARAHSADIATLPAEEGAAFLAECRTHHYKNQELQGSEAFRRALDMFQHGTQQVPQRHILTQLHQRITPLLFNAR